MPGSYLTSRSRTRNTRNDEEKPLNPQADSISQLPSQSSISSEIWLSVYIVSALSFISSAQNTMHITTLWPYLTELDKEITQSFYFRLLATYSAGQIISSYLFGYWSNHIRQVRWPIVVGMVMMFAGNVIYLILEFVDSARYVMLVSRFISGLGSGNIVLMRSYAAMAVGDKDRNLALTFVTCGQAVGLTIGPAFQLFFSAGFFSYPGHVVPLLNIHINIYTASTIVANVFNFISTCVMLKCFKENFTGAEVEIDGEEAKNEDVRQSKLPSYDKIALCVCLLTRFTYMYISTNLESIGSPFSMMMFAWEKEDAVLYMSIAQGIVGLLTLLVYVILIYFKLDNRIDYRVGSMFGLSLMILFHLLTFSWPFLPDHVTMTDHATNKNSIGCNLNKYSWCADLTPINVWFYYVSYCLSLGLAFPILNIGTTTLYSAIIGPRRQGVEQGILQIFGGIARLFAPIIVDALYTWDGPTVIWILDIIVIVLTLAPWFAFFKRIVRLQLPAAEVDEYPQVSVVDIAPDPSVTLSSNSQMHSVPRRTRSQRGSSDISYNSYLDLPKQTQLKLSTGVTQSDRQPSNNL